MYCIYVYSVSSPYLLVCGDDRIRSIREQTMLQVDPVRLRAEAGLDWDSIFLFRVFMMFWNSCNNLYY